MRNLPLAAAPAIFCLFLPAAAIGLQRDPRPAQPALRPTVAPAKAGFQNRSATDRRATAIRLGVPVNLGQLSTPFSVTPRSPAVQGRGSLSSLYGMNLVHVSPHISPPSPTGRLGLHPPGAEAEIELLQAIGRRFLIDCTINVFLQGNSSAASVAISYETIGWGPTITGSTMDVGSGLMSFVTPIFSAGDAPQNTGRVVKIKVAPATVDYFWLEGCEITPLESQ